MASSDAECASSADAAAQTGSQAKLSLDNPQNSDPARPTFLQKHFTKPALVNTDIDTNSSQDNHRHFSFTSRGFLFVAAIMILALIAAIAAAATVGAQSHRRQSNHGDAIIPRLGSPIRSAIPGNFPDPALWYDNGTWHAFATNNAAGIQHMQGANASKNTVAFGEANVLMATSTDFVTWTVANVAHEPLPTVGAWSRGSREAKSGEKRLSGTWAPGVGRRADGKYVMYYSAPMAGRNPRPLHPQPHCIGAALSDSVSGPYAATDEVLACPAEIGGAIDAEAYSDNKTLWMVYKVDGNNVGTAGECGNTVEPIMPTPIMLQKMRPDGMTRDGEPIQILDRIDSDGPLVEAPKIIRSAEGIYFLFFSSGCTRNPSYAVKYATSTSLAGPYRRAKDTFLKTGDWGLDAPGSVGIHEDGKGGWNMAFHARVFETKLGGVRSMFTTKIQLDGEIATMVRGEFTETSRWESLQ